MNGEFLKKLLNIKWIKSLSDKQIGIIKKLLNDILKNKNKIAIMVIISCIFGVIYYNLKNEYSSTVTTTLSYSYKGIEKGLDPTGRSLDTDIIKSDYILKKVIKDLGLEEHNLDIAKLKENINVVPIIPQNIVETVKILESEKDLNINESSENSYYPSKYKVILNMPKEYDLSDDKTENVLNKIIYNYKEYFYNKYSDKDTLENIIGTIDYNIYDYPEISTVINNQIFLINNFLNNKLKTDEGEIFRSKKTNKSFNDIVESVNVLQSVDVDMMDSIIGSYNLTKDKEELIKLYQHRIEKLELLNNKKTDESNITEGIMDKYKKEKNILLVPGIGDVGNEGVDSIGQMEVTGDDSYYDILAEKTTQSGIDSKEAIHDAKYYKDQIDRLENDEISLEDKKIAEKDLLILIESIKEKLEKWIKTTNQTVDDYYNESYLNGAFKYSGLTRSPIFEAKLFSYILFSGMMGIFVSVLLIVGKNLINNEMLSSEKNKKTSKRKRKAIYN